MTKQDSLITIVISVVILLGMAFIALNLGLSPGQQVLWWVLILAHVVYVVVGMWESKLASSYSEEIEEITKRMEAS